MVLDSELATTTVILAGEVSGEHREGTAALKGEQQWRPNTSRRPSIK